MCKLTRSIVLISILLITMLAMPGCQNADMSSTTSTALTSESNTSSESSSSETTAANTTATTSAATTTSTTGATSTTTTGTTGTTAPQPEIDYRPQPADQDIEVDLNGDGIQEVLHYTCVDDYSFNLTLNGETTRRDGEVFLTNWFFLVDLDSVDRYLDIAVQELGPSDDYQVTFFYFDGTRLVLRGVVPGMICDPFSDSIGTDPFGTGSVKLDGLGGLTARARGDVLHTWFFDEPWMLGVDGLLKQVHQDYFPMQNYDPDTGELTQETKVKMLVDLSLLEAPASSNLIGTAKSGEAASLIQTDNKQWVQLRTQGGILGWFQLTDGYRIKINGKIYFSDEVFSGLSFAD